MDNLELKHLAPYLPYGLKILRDGKVMELCGLSSPYKTNNNYFVCGETKVINGTYKQTCSFMIDQRHSDTFKPILRPMSDLIKQELINEGFDSHIDYLTHELQNPKNLPWKVEKAPYNMVEYLFKNHFDVFGLIPAGLAININTLNQK